MKTTPDETINGVSAEPVSPDRGVVARYGDFTLLCDCEPGQHAKVGALLAVLAEAAAGDADGWDLCCRLNELVEATGEDGGLPPLGAVGKVGDGIAGIVHGGAELRVGVNGREMRLGGDPVATDRIVVEPADTVRMTIGGRAVEVPDRKPFEIVHGDGAAPDPIRGQAELEIVRDVDTPKHQTDQNPNPEPPQNTSTAAQDDGAADTAPAASVGDDGLAVGVDEAAQRVEDCVRVLGVHCKNAHFNDPEVGYCTVCGISMAQAVRNPAMGERPQLGVLVFDDGMTVPLCTDHVIGRAPDRDDAVVAGSAGPITLNDPLVSRVHARIELRDWQVHVIDAGSANGTFVRQGNDASWRRSAPGERSRLTPGTAVAFGRRVVRYYTHRDR
ncbi:FHA domain-containing protein [Actinomadura fulvescens]|uniref:FHA domain-containing protein n=1 Tax=Actinomadura fulvescens TaxID=46160 RepID=A0ABP6BQ25_9ACTN